MGYLDILQAVLKEGKDVVDLIKHQDDARIFLKTVGPIALITAFINAWYLQDMTLDQAFTDAFYLVNPLVIASLIGSTVLSYYLLLGEKVQREHRFPRRSLIAFLALVALSSYCIYATELARSTFGKALEDSELFFPELTKVMLGLSPLEPFVQKFGMHIRFYFGMSMMESLAMYMLSSSLGYDPVLRFYAKVQKRYPRLPTIQKIDKEGDKRLKLLGMHTMTALKKLKCKNSNQSY